MKNPLVSIIMPAYNAEVYISEAIESALNQSYDNLEIIVVDDGSTDSTTRVLNSFSERVRVIEQSNQGPSAARNTGLETAEGEFVLFLDADDLLYRDAIRSMIDHLQTKPETDVAVGQWDYIDESGVRIGSLIDHDGIEDAIWLQKTLLVSNLFPLHALLLRTECVRSCKGWDPELKCGEDRDLWLRLVLNGSGFDFVAAPVARYRRQATNSTLNVGAMELYAKKLLDKWFGSGVLSNELEALEPFARADISLFLAKNSREAGDEPLTQAYLKTAGDWLQRAPVDDQLAALFVQRLREKPWQSHVCQVLWKKSPRVVAHHCWSYGRAAIRKHHWANAVRYLKQILVHLPELAGTSLGTKR